MFRSLMAVVAGIVVLTATSFGIEASIAALIGVGSKSSALAHAGMTAYTLFCVAAGGYVTAWVARRAPIGHAVAMGAIELLFTVGAMVQLGETSHVARWLPGIVLMIPSASAGGIIRVRCTGHASAAAEIQ
jgi:hypothetical protein